MKQLSVITTTGARLEAFTLCLYYMQRQTLDNSVWEWIVVDDGPEPIPPSLLDVPDLNIIYVRPTSLWKPGENTMARNLREGLARVSGQFIAFVEDDDWYHRGYLQRMLTKAQEGYYAVGEAQARYYHLPTRRFNNMGNTSHASLCQTMIHNSCAAELYSLLVKDSPFVDIPFWHKLSGEMKLLFPNSVGCVGIKGLPGRAGTGMGHNPPLEWPTDDANTKQLRWWIGEDVSLYRNFL